MYGDRLCGRLALTDARPTDNGDARLREVYDTGRTAGTAVLSHADEATVRAADNDERAAGPFGIMLRADGNNSRVFRGVYAAAAEGLTGVAGAVVGGRALHETAHWRELHIPRERSGLAAWRWVGRRHFFGVHDRRYK